jgi:hypothetical protein
VSNDANRTLITLVAAAMIIVMAVLIFLTWTADTDVIDRVGDFAEYLDDNNDNAGKLIITLAALIVVVLALLVIVLELAPEDEEKELRVKQAGATTIVPAAALRGRIEEALLAMREVTSAKAKVNTRDNGIATALDLTLIPNANIAATTQEAARVVSDTVQNDLGLPVAGVPNVRVTYGGTKESAVASSTFQRPADEVDQAAPGAAASAQPSDPAAVSPEPPAEPAAAAPTEPPPEPIAAEVSGPPSPVTDSPSDPTSESPSATQADGPDDAGSGTSDREMSRDPWRQP